MEVKNVLNEERVVTYVGVTDKLLRVNAMKRNSWKRKEPAKKMLPEKSLSLLHSGPSQVRTTFCLHPSFSLSPFLFSLFPAFFSCHKQIQTRTHTNAPCPKHPYQKGSGSEEPGSGFEIGTCPCGRFPGTA